MNNFRLFAHGETFDPNSYLASTPLKFDGVWHKDELRKGHPKSNGVFKVLGDGLTVPIWQQEQIAIDYISVHRAALKELAQAPGVTTFILGLHIQVDLEEGLIGFTVSPSTRLMKLAMDIGIDPTYYVTLERGKDREESTADE